MGSNNFHSIPLNSIPFPKHWLVTHRLKNARANPFDLFWDIVLAAITFLSRICNLSRMREVIISSCKHIRVILFYKKQRQFFT